jgi:hypothetical protein
MSDYSAIDISTLPAAVREKLAKFEALQQSRRAESAKRIKNHPEHHRLLSKKLIIIETPKKRPVNEPRKGIIVAKPQS